MLDQRIEVFFGRAEPYLRLDLTRSGDSVIGVGDTLSGRFILEKELGQGGLSIVYRAADRVLGRNVAIKLLKVSGTKEELDSLRLEAQILARLVHDRILRLYDFGDSEGLPFLVMEEVNGPSFAGRRRDLLLDSRLRICAQVAEALDHAHVQGVIHRDVKPGNVLITPDDDAKLSDFGLSFFTDDRKDPSGAIRGTPRYMSPEQAQGKALDHRTDLYSLGVMLYECATGTPPFDGQPLAVINQHINSAPPLPRLRNAEISPMLEHLILSLLEKSPAKRPASGNVVACAIAREAERERLLQGITRRLSQAQPRDPTDRPPSTTITLDGRRAGPTVTYVPGQLDAERAGLAKVAAPAAHAIPPPSSADISPWAGPGPSAALSSYRHPIAREMLSELMARPVVLSPDERYLCGHYLAYLLGGPRRRGLFLRRPLDERNASRARLLLAMSWLSCIGAHSEAIERAAALLDERPDVRAALTPVAVIRYLASRDTPAKLKRFRQARKSLQEASTFAREAMLDYRGVLNPGMLPRYLDDLATIAPLRAAVDGHRVSLWNRVTEVWRRDTDFRQAVLRYASRSADLDGVSADLWPEVVYPLIERAHWQRIFRPRHEAIWDYIVGGLLHIPVPGVRLDRVMDRTLPREVAQQFDEDLYSFKDDPHLDDDDEPVLTESRPRLELRPAYYGATIPRDEVSDDAEYPRVREIVPLSPAEPFLVSQDSLRGLWSRAKDGPDRSHRPGPSQQILPVGPYRLAVTSSSRGRSAIVAALQGFHDGKQIEIITPSAFEKDTAARTAIAIWSYGDSSLLVTHLDFQSKVRYVLWHAPNSHQLNFEYIAELKSLLATVYLEIPGELDRILSRR